MLKQSLALAMGLLLASAPAYGGEALCKRYARGGQFGTFSATGDMISTRSLHTATLLKDGRVLLVGGANSEGKFLSSAEIYHPGKRRFIATGSMSSPRMGGSRNAASGWSRSDCRRRE